MLNHRSHTERFPGGQTKQRQECGQQIIEHYTETTPQRLIVISDGRWFDYIEQTKQQKCKCLPHDNRWRKEEYQRESGNFIPNHAAMIVIAERAASDTASPDTDEKHHRDQDEKSKRIEEVSQDPKQGKSRVYPWCREHSGSSLRLRQMR